MQLIDKIIFGDNQFFWYKSYVPRKSSAAFRKFYDFQSIIDVYQMAINSNVRGLMLNSNDRAGEICNHFVVNRSKYPELRWYPSIPYPHKYANLISEKGIIPTINEILFKDSSALGVLGTIVKGSSSCYWKGCNQITSIIS